MNDEKQFKLEQLKFLYEKQHYFIDRHEVMAEKYFAILTMLASVSTILMTVTSEKMGDFKYYIIGIYIIFLILFVISLIKLINIVNPMSTILMNKHKEIKKKKSWVNESFIYYRGIVNKFKSISDDEFIEELEIEKLSLDFVRQINVLAEYSNHKREKLEEVKIWVVFAIIFSSITIILLIIAIHWQDYTITNYVYTV